MNSLVPMKFNNQRIITTKDLAESYGATEKNIQMNFANNEGRFVEGKHHYKLEGQLLKSFKKSLPNNIGGPLKYVPTLILWTEKRAVRHAKILDTDEAWEVYEALEESYFRVKEQKQLRLQYQALEMQDKRIEGVTKKVDDLEANMPLFNVECKELQNLVRRVGTKVLGGYKSPAYCSNSLRGKVYSHIQHQLRREFGIERYEAIKRSQLYTAKKIVESYKAPLVLVNGIDLTNSQLSFSEEAV